MLTNARNYTLDTHDEIDFIHNYYERLVLQEIFAQSSRVQEGDRDFLADVACVALNRMPPRYPLNYWLHKSMTNHFLCHKNLPMRSIRHVS